MIKNYYFQPYNTGTLQTEFVNTPGFTYKPVDFNHNNEKEKRREEAYLTGGLIALGLITIGALIFKGKDIAKLLKKENTVKVSKNAQKAASETKTTNNIKTVASHNNVTEPVNNSVSNRPGPTSTASKQVINQTLPNNPTALDKATNEVIKGWEKVAEEAKGKTNRYNNCQTQIQRLIKGERTPESVYTSLFNDYYYGIRLAKYPKTSKYNEAISDITQKETRLMQVADEQNGWHFRLPRNRHADGWSTKGKSVDRISVNAETDQKLIYELDQLFGSGEIKGMYKTPDQSFLWLTRHDPITIYLYEKATPEVLAKIERVTKPFIRSNKDVLVGHKFAPGLALEKSPQPQDIQQLIDEANKIDPALGTVFKNLMQRNNFPKASSGQVTAAKKVLNLLSQP